MPLMKGMTVVLFIAGYTVPATVRHLISITDNQGTILSNKPKYSLIIHNYSYCIIYL